MFGTLVALLRDGEPVLGVIDQPITRERWLGVRGRPTTLNGAPWVANPWTNLLGSRGVGKCSVLTRR